MKLRASGGFVEFIRQAKHFAPPNVTMRIGERLVATNRGGEVHTFTEVEEFGGGIVPDLNELTGLPTVAPRVHAACAR